VLGSSPGADAVVRSTEWLSGEEFSAASLAQTVKVYTVPGRRPVTSARVASPPTLWTRESSW
jgi:hypothetical protein